MRIQTLFVLLFGAWVTSVAWAARRSQDPERKDSAEFGAEETALPVPEGAVFRADRLEQVRSESGRAYHEFLRVPALSAGIYGLSAGAADGQAPHAADEIYHVLEGRAVLRIGADDHSVEAGSIAYVRAGVAHRFHSIEADLLVLVFFGAEPDER